MHPKEQSLPKILVGVDQPTACIKSMKIQELELNKAKV